MSIISSPDPLTAEDLRKAAAKLREMAQGTTPAPWEVFDCELYPRWILGQPEGDSVYATDVAKSYTENGEDGLTVSDADWRWMAFASPAIAEPLAALLDDAADRFDYFCDLSNKGHLTLEYELAVARVILGGAE